MIYHWMVFHAISRSINWWQLNNSGDDNDEESMKISGDKRAIIIWMMILLTIIIVKSMIAVTKMSVIIESNIEDNSVAVMIRIAI